MPSRAVALIAPGEAYFLHSFAFEGTDILATTDHAGPVTAAIGRDTMIGVQFHPESILTEHGHQLLQNFLKGAKP